VSTQTHTTRVLIVAHRTAATPALIDAVRARAARGPCRFTLLVPRPYWDPDTDEAALTLELAIPLLEEAVGGRVDGMTGDHDPLTAVRDALAAEPFDEAIVSTLPARVSHWLRRDLPTRVEHLGLPVTVVTAKAASRDVVSG
jgi:hypothetical protein